jgi:hypothetical protein
LFLHKDKEGLLVSKRLNSSKSNNFRDNGASNSLSHKVEDHVTRAVQGVMALLNLMDLPRPMVLSIELIRHKRNLLPSTMKIILILLRLSMCNLIPVASWRNTQRGPLLRRLKNMWMPSVVFQLRMMVVCRDFGVKLRTHSSKPKLCLSKLISMSCTARIRLLLL